MPDLRDRTVLLLVLAAGALALAGCADDGSKSSPDAAVDAGDTDDDEADAGPDACAESAGDGFPDGLTEIAYEEAGGTQTILSTSLGGFDMGGGNVYFIGEEPMWEAVRFDLAAPATVYGARVQWGNLTGDGERPVLLGVYDDFGSNGFDFFQWEPRWTGTRCLAPEQAGEWVDYALDEPIEVELPGMIYVAQFWSGDANAPLLRFETTTVECDEWDNCHSAINMPEAEAALYYNGLSAPMSLNYAVRLLVELHDTIPAEDKSFQLDEALTASSRVAWGDYDNDGDDDLMTNGPTLYRNDGDGSFTDVSTAAGLGALIAGSGGGVWGDYDNDGCLDYFGQGTGTTAPDILLHNECDGTFGDATLASQITDQQDYLDCVTDVVTEYSPTEGSAWVDIDADGYLDLYLAEYECGGVYENYRDRVWHNEGDGTFSEWTEGHGFIYAQMHAGRGVSPIDHDLDGDVDILVSNYRLDPNFFFDNDGDGTVSNWGIINGLEGHAVSGAYGHTIGSAWIDLENDGDWDLIESNLAHPRFYHFSDRTMVLVNDGAGFFTDSAATAGIHYRETHSNPTVQDFDNDGDQDLFLTCVYNGRFSELYFNNGDGTFAQVNYETGAIVRNGWGSAASDYDLDGDMDLVAYDLLRNESAAAGNHWLQVRALGGAGAGGTVNAAGIGSVIKVTVDGVVHLGHTSGGSGTGCQDSAFLGFGLGAATSVDQIEVLYPNGTTVTVSGPIAADQRVWIEADGSVTYGWSPPA